MLNTLYSLLVDCLYLHETRFWNDLLYPPSHLHSYQNNLELIKQKSRATHWSSKVCCSLLLLTHQIPAQWSGGVQAPRKMASLLSLPDMGELFNIYQCHSWNVYIVCMCRISIIIQKKKKKITNCQCGVKKWCMENLGHQMCDTRTSPASLFHRYREQPGSAARCSRTPWNCS